MITANPYSLNGYKLKGLGCGPACGCQQMNGLGAIVYNSTPTSDWSCGDWMVWHQELVKAFMGGKFASGIKYSQQDAINNANKVFAQWWDKAASISDSNFCGYNSGFLEYFKSVGYTDHISYIAGILTPIFKGGTNASSAVQKTGEAAENAADAAKNTTKTLQWLLPVGVVTVVALVGGYVYKNYIKGNSRVKVGPATV
jgi:hypothetical protein